MPRVFIPALLREFSGGRAEFTIEGSTVRQVIDKLDRECPGVRERLIEGDRLRPNVSVAIDGEVTPLALLEMVAPDSEIHFVVAISGGASGH